MARVAKKKVTKKAGAKKGAAKKGAATKKQDAGAAERALKAENKKLRTRLAAAESSLEKWKARAKDQKSSAAGANAELNALRRSLEKAEASVTKWKDRAKSALPAAEPRSGPTMAPAPTAARAETMAPTAPQPDETWTLTALRAEARARGVAGYSRKPKAQLVAELRR